MFLRTAPHLQTPDKETVRLLQKPDVICDTADAYKLSLREAKYNIYHAGIISFFVFTANHNIVRIFPVDIFLIHDFFKLFEYGSFLCADFNAADAAVFAVKLKLER